jgi:hypothetical protein
MKLSTRQLKEFVAGIVDKQKSIQNELLDHCMNNGSDPKNWIRTHKSKIGKNDVVGYAYLYDPNEFVQDLVNDGWGIWPTIPQDKLLGCNVRYLNFRQHGVSEEDSEGGDAAFVIITDKNDENVVFWQFNCD